MVFKSISQTLRLFFKKEKKAELKDEDKKAFLYTY